ncbi:hypothetical protein A2715_04075 [Candidatus Woesebacteria bacterium RIFCSPHIGHO2_01_FULL_39_32]|uniref:SpoVT-AbrB domain-containing protein n=1 Tax=Candidatus Woesebacteria bacterium RIFCSPLOWO2_01_FULL_39_25 TaxID=1802521 RepID=A0A1F8BL92_9BACT|nr:MAG: hypothetical protein A2124_04230 [Candidatus Woesebacteria bacterium GWB1_37_5]OGM25198.1 MAG: hypothetical protein A2715_04075 [Candidatus Woesebacteria bacterium RIFCSPHIGHO2_01_FULL_39_32]OGM37699.1 MAG: hypothetical protein A3F01_01275 [Candidatus Woesebacteria bacterium RIFCSPHIGHO2_12_FULL_38_11]OGM64730.1 MAG: hypothetical protein A2893_03685 [Candidatus Woesebacteria bacterium RIFCSPLOWO2_01_FULL_39_25]
MKNVISEEIIKIQPRGSLTIPKKLREDVGIRKNTLVRIIKEKGRLIIEPVRTLPYPARSYTDKEIDEFLELDAKETKELKSKGIL